MTANTIPDIDARQIDLEKAREATKMLLEALGEDPHREGLIATWQRRVPDAFETLTEGSRSDAKPEMRTFKADNDELVVKTGIRFQSLCEHHLLPYHGHAHIAYRPKDTVVGLSKLARFTRWKSRQLSIQEELTSEIAEGLNEELDAQCVLVRISATHMCETMRGVERESLTHTVASANEPTERDWEQFDDAIDRWSSSTRR